MCCADLIQKLRYRERERQRLQRQKSRDRDTRRTLSYDTPPFYMSEGASDSGANTAGPTGGANAAGASDGNANTADPLSAQRRQLGERLYPKVQMLQPVSVCRNMQQNLSLRSPD